MDPSTTTTVEGSILCYESSYDLVLGVADSEARYGVSELDICGESSVLRERLLAERRITVTMGKTASEPFVLKGLRKSDLEALLGCRTNDRNVMNDFIKLKRALQVATMYGMKPTRQRIIAAMTAHRSFPTEAPILLRMGYTARVKRWFHQGFSTIVVSPLSTLSLVDCKTIGGDLMYYLVQGRKHMEMLYHLQALGVPQFHSSVSCSRQACRSGWQRFWGRTVQPMLLNGDRISSRIIRERLNTLPSGMCANCFRLNVQKVCDSGELDVCEDLATFEAHEAWKLASGDGVTSTEDTHGGEGSEGSEGSGDLQV